MSRSSSSLSGNDMSLALWNLKHQLESSEAALIEAIDIRGLPPTHTNPEHHGTLGAVHAAYVAQAKREVAGALGCRSSLKKSKKKVVS